MSNWATPNTPSGGPNTKSTSMHTGGLDLDGQVLVWNGRANLADDVCGWEIER